MIDGTTTSLKDEERGRVMKTMSWPQPTKALRPFPPTPLKFTLETTVALRTVLPPWAWLASPVERIVSTIPTLHARSIALVGVAPTIDALRMFSIPLRGMTPAEIGLPPILHSFSRYPRFLTKPRLLTRL